MDSRVITMMIFTIMGAVITTAAVALAPPAVFLGVIIAAFPGILMYTTIRRSGVDPLLQRPVKGQVLILYVSASRRVFLLIGRELMERYIKLPGYGRVRVTRGSDLLLAGWKTFIAMAGCAHTIPPDKIRQATEFKMSGITNFKDLAEKAGLSLPEDLEEMKKLEEGAT